MPEVRIIAKNFMDMVASLPAMKLDLLYQNPFICEAILRSLPPLAKKYVLQMLYIDTPVSAKLLLEWVLPDGATKHRVAVDRLIQLRVFFESVDRKRESSYKLNPTFQANLQRHLLHGGVLPREPMATSITVRLPTRDELDAYALQQWENFLLQLIGSSTAERPTNFSSSTMKVFQRGLVTQRDREGLKLTESGFQFLLMDTNAQLWYIIREYISNSEERDTDASDLISFLLELSFHVMGEAYNMNTLTETQKSVIKDLADLGLVKLQQGRKESWFIPTKLATNLSMSLTDSSTRKEEVRPILDIQFPFPGSLSVLESLLSANSLWPPSPSPLVWGSVVVETNFRMHSYSSSKLHCEILRLFARVEYQLPNLIVSAITRESLNSAFENGITGDQIIAFLQQNAHPRVAERIPSVPENVTDQIRLWESDLNRVEMTPSYLYDEFLSKEVFEAACDYAREWNGFLWEDTKRMRLAVKADIHNNMREYLRSQK